MRPRCWGQEGERGHGSREGWSLPIRLQVVPWLSPTHRLCPGVPSAVSQLFLGPGRRLLFQSPIRSSSLFGLRPGAALPPALCPNLGSLPLLLATGALFSVRHFFTNRSASCSPPQPGSLLGSLDLVSRPLSPLFLSTYWPRAASCGGGAKGRKEEKGEERGQGRNTS